MRRRRCGTAPVDHCAHRPEQRFPLVGLLDEVHPFLQDEVGVDGIGAVTAGEQKTDTGSLVFDLSLYIPATKTGHHHVEQGHVYLAFVGRDHSKRFRAISVIRDFFFLSPPVHCIPTSTVCRLHQFHRWKNKRIMGSSSC